MGWAQFDRRVRDTGGLGTIRAVFSISADMQWMDKLPTATLGCERHCNNAQCVEDSLG